MKKLLARLKEHVSPQQNQQSRRAESLKIVAAMQRNGGRMPDEPDIARAGRWVEQGVNTAAKATHHNATRHNPNRIEEMEWRARQQLNAERTGTLVVPQHVDAPSIRLPQRTRGAEMSGYVPSAAQEYQAPVDPWAPSNADSHVASEYTLNDQGLLQTRITSQHAAGGRHAARF